MTLPEAAPLPPLYLPGDIAKALHCSEWWVKEQARKGRIPFTKLGGKYRFTAEHFAEITHIFESRPAESAGTVTPATSQQRRQAAQVQASVSQLRARTPRRAQRSQSRSSTA